MNNPSQSINSFSNIQIRGYQIVELVYTGSRTLVYRAVRIHDQLPVVIKLLKNDYCTFSELLQFRNQYTIAKNLTSPLIIQTYSLEPYQNGYALVMEDFGGISLKEWISKGKNVLFLREFLEIAIDLCNILDILYRQRIIHKDIKPANILINPETKQVKLIDFSIASLLPQETQTLINPNVLEGTLAYISPEQTGRMNRGVDYRTDFYSLGVTFYELLTGELPFLSKDPMELVHSHIAKPAPLVHEINPQIPFVVSKIISKLIAKNAEDRYQSASGIKSDLEKCLTQLQETGEIKYFEIGKIDLCDRFSIPEKLYGREIEVETLLQAFDRVSLGATEIMLVAGFSGIGKTAVVNEVHKPIVRQRGYFIKGKYDQFQRNIPFSAFVQAFRDLMGQLLSESDQQIQTWKNKILTVLRDNGQVLIDVIPELENIIGSQPPATELSGTAAQNRFNLLLPKFVQIFTSIEHPLVMFLDDLQWADSASLKLLQLLIAETGHLLVLGAYRDNEVSPAHPFILTVEEIIKAGATVNTITLQPLSLVSLNQLVADTLNCELFLAQPLTELVYQKTQGNPFFATQFLKSLYEDAYINFDWETRHWQSDITTVQSLSLTEDVVEFMALQLQKLSLTTQNTLKLAACIGAQFDLHTLAIVSEKPPEITAADLWQALQEGLIIPNTEIYKFFIQFDSVLVANTVANPTYRFLHDRVQQAAYSLIPDSQKQTIHYQIGQLLRQQISSSAIEDRIFEVVNQLNYGTALISQQTERNELAQLNLIACRKAKSSTAYQAGREYASTGLLLLGENAWQQQYEITLAFHNDLAELSMLCGDFEVMEKFLETVIAQAHSLPEKVHVYRLRIQANISQKKLMEAITIGIQLLEQLGVTMTESPTPADIQQSIQEISELIGDRQVADFVDLPVMTDAKTIAIVQIVNGIMAAAYASGSLLFPLLTVLSVKLSLRHGNIAASASSYACYSMIVCNMQQDVDLAIQFGQLALNLVSKLDAKANKPEVLMILGSCILHRKAHIKETLPLLREGYTIGLEVGNLEYLGHCGTTFCINSFWWGQSLTTLEQDTHTYYNALVQLNQLIPANYCLIYWQSMLNLLGFGSHPTLLSGSALQETEFLPLLQSANNLFGLYHFYLHKLMLGFLFGEVELASNYAVEGRNYLKGAVTTVGEPIFYFYDSLIALALLSQQSGEVSTVFERVAENQTQLQPWAHHAPMNYQHKVDLVEAEKCRVSGQKVEASEFYDKAIAGAKTNEYIQEEALANELAAKFYLDWGRQRIASEYMIEAYYAYARWGAKAKVADLERRYPQLLASILQQTRTAFSVNETVFATSTVTSTSSSSSSSSISDSLDLATILKASQALSGEIELEKLLSSLLAIVIENAGADKCVLMLLQDEHLLITGSIAVEAEPVVLQHLPIEDSQEIPLKLIYKVKNNQQTVVLLDATADTTLTNDPYMTRQQPKSILCSPIVYQGKLLGVLYLENNLATGAFTSDRVEFLNLLCAQAAISLENAHLYEQSQTYAHELEQSLEKLQSSEARFQKLTNNVPGVIYQLHVTAHGAASILYMSSGCYKLYEVTAEEMMAGIHNPRAMEHPDDAPGIKQAMLESAATLKPFVYEWRIITPSGIIKWVQAASLPEKYPDGSIIWDGLIMDISDRKQAEAALYTSQQRLSLLIQQTPMAVIEWDSTFRIQSWNPAAEKIFGYTAAEVMGRSLDFLITDATGKLHADQIVADLLTQTGGHRSTKENITKTGEIICCDWYNNPLINENGDLICVATIAIDVTELKQTEKQLQESQQLLELVLNTIPYKVFWKDCNLIYQGSNRAFAEVVGFSSSTELVGKSDYDLSWTREESDSFRQFDRRVIETNQSELWIVETTLQADGTTAWIETSKLPLHDPNGIVIGVLGIYRDISDRKHAEMVLQQKSQDLAKALKDLQQAQIQMIQSEKMSALGNLVAGVAHEINNPIGFIAGNLSEANQGLQDLIDYVQLYQAKFPEPGVEVVEKAEEIDLDYLIEDLPKMLESMQNGCDRIKFISKSLRTFSRADDDHQQFFDIHEGIDSTVMILRHRLKANDSRPAIEVLTNYGELAPLNCFPGQLNQVFMNVLANAIDALEESNHGLSFAEIKANPNKITITTTVVDRHVQISIMDNGKGMSTEIKDKVFNHLFTTKEVGKGTGLGLAIARQIIEEKHHGYIEVNSSLGTGTEFIITLPMKAA